ncbi:MAG: hypothetical protein WBS54_16025 [Acidobacteriota bacterium]
MHHSRLLAAALSLIVAAACPAWSAEPAQTVPEEIRSEVPALSAYHEVIYPLWHEAWPKRDTTMMKRLLPEVQAGASEIQKAQLPGILRDKKGRWDAGVSRLAEAVDRYGRAAASGDDAALIRSVEDLHAAYEGLVRIVRPTTRELDAYHVVLYRIVHHEMPAGDIEAVRASSRELASKCTALRDAPLPTRYAAKETGLKQAILELCGATDALKTAAQGSDPEAVRRAVDGVHTRYQALEGMFD